MIATRRLARFSFVLVAATTALLACSSDPDAPPDDAGAPDGSSVRHDASTPVDGSVDAAADTSNAVDASADARPIDSSTPHVDAGADASNDTGADSAPDAMLPDASTPDASMQDASIPDATVLDASTPDASMQDASILDAAAEAQPTCAPTCATGLTFLGGTASFVTGGRSLNLLSDAIPAGNTVSATTQTYPQGAAQSVHAVYTTDAFATTTDLTLTYDHAAGNNDQWYVVLPAEAAGTSVTWYLYATSCDCARLYDSANGLNFTYLSE